MPSQHSYSLFRNNPLLMPLLFYIAGIGIMYFVADSFALYCALFALFFGLLIVVLMLFQSVLRRVYKGFLFMWVLLLAGMCQIWVATGHAALPQKQIQYTGIALSATMPTTQSNYVDVLLLEGCDTSRYEPTKYRERVRVFLPENIDLKNILPGDSINLTARVIPTRNTSNPKGFRYDRYLNAQGIWYSVFPDSASIKQGGNSGKYIVKRNAAIARQAMISSFARYGIRDNEFAVIAALVAGERAYLSEELELGYGIAGAFHILAVSGLHVGILYLFLNIILYRGISLPMYRLTRLGLLILILWIYAFITGLSPSVVRAATMFSIYHIGKNTHRDASGVNILAASALLVLIVDPMQLFNVGFQLSYLAVFGILIFQPIIVKVFSFKNSIFNYCWEITSLSLAVQLAVYPLNLFYFHYYPSYFLLTNIFAIPLLWLIMMVSMIFFALLPFPALAGLVVKILNILLQVLNTGILTIANLPFSVIHDIRFTLNHLISAFLLLIVLLVFLRTRKTYQLITRILLILVLTILIDEADYFIDARRAELIVYNSRHNVFMSIIDGHNHLLICDIQKGKDEETDIHYLSGYWLDRRISKGYSRLELDECYPGKKVDFGEIEIATYANGLHISLNGKTYFYCRKYDSQLTEFEERADVLIVNQGSAYPAYYNLHELGCTELIYCKNTPYSLQKAWSDVAVQQKYGEYLIGRQGAYVNRSRQMADPWH